jgi:hypothetical protein
MSSVNDMVVKTSNLVDKVTELIRSDTVKALPEVAAQLGVEQIFNDGVSALAGLLRSLHGELSRLEDAVAQFDAVSGIIGLIEPLILAIGRMAASGAEGIASYGIPQAQTVATDIGTGFNYVESAFTVIKNITVDADDFHELLDSLLELADEVEKTRTDAPAEEAA